MSTIVGTCGKCGGPVEVPTAYWSVTPPRPTCQSCGAFAKENYGPILPMESASEKPSPYSARFGQLTVR